MSQEPATYDASRITVLHGLEAVRRRPGMYIGTTGERGLHLVVTEAAGWSFDEILHGRASRLDVTLRRDGGVRLADDGPGVEFGTGPSLTIALTVLTAGRSKVGPRYPMSGVLGEVSVVNALSSRLVADVRRDGRRYVQEFARGVPVAPVADTGPTSGSGNAITFWPDADIFETTEFSFETLVERFRELAFVNRELDISLTDERGGAEPRSVRLHFPDGVRELLAFLDGGVDDSEIDDSEIDDSEIDDSEIAGFEEEEPETETTMDIAWRWHGSGPERVQSFANSQPTPAGGTHLLGFRDGVAAALTAYARERQLLASMDPDIGADRIGRGLTAVVSVKVKHPQFEGCTRDVLGTAEVRGYVRQAVQHHVGLWLAANPQQAKEILNRIR
ncbi:DNA gyrase subunit B [Catenulispora rubra]|uniref:DNA gyrase subunit B n=1 Tax=Catenulispora rubra TaxID=280293 RepID=UPI00189228C4|nr:DNA gyrase subunit B [Catenulispora rubra]